LILGRRVAAGCHGAQVRVYEAVLTCALYDVLGTDAELVAVAATALTVVAGAAIRLARARASRGINAVAATALIVGTAGAAIRTTRRSARPAYALLSLCTAVEAAATVILVSIKVYAPVVAASLAFRAATNLVVSPPDAVLRAALGVPTTFPPQTPAIIIGQGHRWYGAQSGSEEGATNLSALPLERVPVASPFASSSKEVAMEEPPEWGLAEEE
jgi:hypothetical protein